VAAGFGDLAAARREVASPLAAAGERPVHRYPVLAIAIICATVALLSVPFGPALGWLWDTWTTRPEYSHGPIMPLIACFLAWQQKDVLQRLEFRGSWWGPILVLSGGLLLFMGMLGGAYTVQQYALVVALAGMALALSGGAAFGRLVAPLIVLVLMIPQPVFILNNLSSKLQLLSSALGVAFIRAFGISVYLEGNVIDLGAYKLQVVEACDGLRYLFPLMAIGLLIAYFYKGAFWKRALVFVASVPLTILMNSLRVGTIGFLVEHWGSPMAEGFLHDFQGWMVFMVSAALLVALTAALNRVGPAVGTWRETFGLEFPAPTPRGARTVVRRLPAPFMACVAAVLAIGVAFVLTPARPETVPARQAFVTFPVALGEWQGRRSSLDPDVLAALQLDDYILADYSRRGRDVVNLYASYYSSQRDRRVVHSPRACIPGGGWQIEQAGTASLGKHGLQVNRMVIADGNARQLVYYWFDQRGRDLTSEYMVKWYLFWDVLTRHRSDGAMVRLVTPISRSDAPGAADARLAAFAAHVAPLLPAYIPR
jgi:exosortase D (VPLPA-CTERM-specific)